MKDFNFEIFKRSHFSNRKLLLFFKCSIFLTFPPDKLSIHLTLKPLDRKRSTVWLPMNPAPPVIKTVLFFRGHCLFLECPHLYILGQLNYFANDHF